ncbi:MAG: SPFH/Band 7/PHB domain protein [Lentisphaeraceae bacterium]|nr:SPFH/Band 7/PHB domain protein [Lentisphaeraceae bacterium]
MISQIPQGHCRIIERFAKPVKIQYSGLAFKIPFLDKVRDVRSVWGDETNKQGIFIELTEQIIDTHPRECITKDNAKVLVDSVLSWRVSDPIKAVYEVDHLHKSLIQAALNAIRSEIGERDLDQVLSSRSQLNERIASTLTETSQKWGIQVLRAEIQELKTDDATSTAMLQQLEAERRSRAIAAEAEGSATATIRKAKADREAAIFRAEGQAKALDIIAASERSYLNTLSESIGKDEAAKILMAQKVLEGYAIISEKPGDKVFIPSSVNSFLDLGNS